MPRIILSVPLVAVVAAAVAGCGGQADEGLDQTGFGLVFAPEAAAGCVSSGTGTGKLPADVAWLVGRLLDGAGVEVAAGTASQADLDAGDGQVLLKGVPPGTWTFEVTGCSSAGRATWRGTTPGVRVGEHSKVAPLVFLLPSGRLACAGGNNRNPLTTSFDGARFVSDGRTAFGAAVVTPSGRAVFAGGGADLRSTDRLPGGTAVWEFRRDAGVFVPIESPSGARLALAEPRLMHGMVALDADHVMVVGGASAVDLSVGYPGQNPPVRPTDNVPAAVEVLSLADGATQAIALQIGGAPWSTAVPAWAWSSGAAGSRLALAGGLAMPAGSPADGVVVLDPSQPPGAAVSGKLGAPRFGGVARFLSTGDLLVVGGWTGSAAAAPELVRIEGGKVVATPLQMAAPPPGIQPTAFPLVEVLSDSGTGATVLVASGNPLGSPPYSSPTAANAWTITLEGDGTRYDPAKGKAVSLAIDPASEWPFVRSVASSARIGDGILVAGGVRTFVKVAGFEDCKDGQGKELDYCFPRSFAVVTPGADGGIGAVETIRLPHGRLGVTAVALDRDQVLLLGGIAGFGDNPPADYDWKPPDAPSEWKTSSWVLSSALIAVRAGAFSDDACAAHPPAAPAD